MFSTAESVESDKAIQLPMVSEFDSTLKLLH